MSGGVELVFAVPSVPLDWDPMNIQTFGKA